MRWRERLPHPADYYPAHVARLGRANGEGWAQGLSPFHEDSSASLSVHVDSARGGWRCFAGCGHGDLVSFHMCLPDKGDCADWLATHPGATHADVLALPLAPRVLIQREWPADDEAPQVILVGGSELQPEPVDWLWPGWLAAGKLHLLCGQTGTGKTTIAICGIVTVGGRCPSGLWKRGDLERRG
ncbi:AAA family ATPase [Lysobacter sp. GCM10012299]|uniref:AAA family ATPase n=1 Tax=Lysobacter sp. GCM10012299 TaxID=3317333 RepID=UPI0036194001